MNRKIKSGAFLQWKVIQLLKNDIMNSQANGRN